MVSFCGQSALQRAEQEDQAVGSLAPVRQVVARFVGVSANLEEDGEKNEEGNREIGQDVTLHWWHLLPLFVSWWEWWLLSVGVVLTVAILA